MDIIVNPPEHKGKNLAPQMPTEPPKEVKEMTFSAPPENLFDAQTSIIITDNGTKLTEVPKEFSVDKKDDKVVEQPKEIKKDEPKKEVVKEEPKSVLKAPKTEHEKAKDLPSTDVKEGLSKVSEKSSTISPITPPIKEKDEFDYTGYAPQEVVNLKNMSRQSREWVAGLVKDKKQLEPLKDSTYLQHEEAYKLNPEYNEIQTSVQRAQIEGNFWREQLLNIKAGKPFRDLQGFKPDGTPVLSEEKQPTDADELRLANNYTLCTQEGQRRYSKLQEYPNQFKTRISNDLAAIQQKQSELFAWVADPKLMEHSVEVEGRGDVALKDLKRDFISLIPPYLQNHPSTQLAANMFIGLQIRNAELREARKTNAVSTIHEQEERRTEPTSDKSPTQQTGNGKFPASFGAGEQLMESLGLR